MEIWKDIEGYEGIYQVSNLGNWKNLSKNKQPQGRLRNGYIVVSVGRGKNEEGLHRKVAKAFPEICGEWFENCDVHHKNFNKLDNRAENLIVLSKKEHSRIHYPFQSDRFKKASDERSKSISKALKGKTNTHRQIPIIQLTLEGVPIRIFRSGQEAAKYLNKSQGNITSACKGKLLTAYGYRWEYYYPILVKMTA